MFTIWDLLLPPIYLFIIFFIADLIRKRNIVSDDAYKYFTYGLFAKILGGIFLCLIYVFYYNGGDTVNYYQSSGCMINLLFKDWRDFLEAIFKSEPVDRYMYFDYETGFPVYWLRDKYAFFTVKLIIPFELLAFKSFIVTSILTATVSFTGMWKLYQVFYREYPEIKKELAIAILFIPSVVFLGSGLMKDTFTIGAVGWYTYAFYYVFIKKDIKYSIIFALLISTYIIVSIKPYILFALLPGSLIWMLSNRLKNIKNVFFRWFAAPLLVTIIAASGYFIMLKMSDDLGVYAMDKVLDRAVVVQQDLKKDYYGGKTYDLGDFDASIGSMLSKAPLAINYALFRPYLWDAKNLVMLISALENAFILGFTILLLIRLRVVNFFSLIRANPLLLFSFLFAIFFAFLVFYNVINIANHFQSKILLNLESDLQGYMFLP
jgi:hypothetical protein